MDLTDLHRMLYLTPKNKYSAQQYTEAFLTIYNKFRKVEITLCDLSEYKSIKSKVNYKQISSKYANSLRLNLLND